MKTQAIAGLTVVLAMMVAADPVLPEPAGFVWAPVSGASIPENAYSAAPAGAAPVRICRVRHNRDVEIGSAGEAFCHIGGDGMNRPYSLYEVLVAAPGAGWATVSGGEVPAAAIPLNAGRGPDRFACRTVYRGRTLVGTVDDGTCSAGFDVSELRSDDYEVLVAGDGAN